MKNNKFEKKIKQQVIQPYLNQQARSGTGVILYYDSVKNTATVLMSQTGTDRPGELLTNVACPTQMGIQGVAPEQGRQCWVDFRTSDTSAPFITHFFSVDYEQFDYVKQKSSKAPMPRYIMDM